MDFVLANWMLILVALVSGAMLFVPALAGGAGGAAAVPAAEAVRLMNREKAVVVDVREAAEYAAGRIAGARHVPLGELEAKLPATVKNKALPVVLCCASGARSARAVAVARKLGYDNARTLAGGLKAWSEAGLPVEKG